MSVTMDVKKKTSFQETFYEFLQFLFKTYHGHTVLMMFLILGIVMFLGSFSEPMRAVVGRPLLPITLDEKERAGRIIILYHSLAIPFLAGVVFLVMNYYDIRERLEPLIRWPLLIGAIMTPITGMLFSYIFNTFMLDEFEFRWVFHGLFLVSLSLVFFSGVLFLIGIFPTKTFPKRETHQTSPYYAWINLEYLNMAIVTICLLISAIIGAIVGSFFGNGFEAILSEDIVRKDHNILERMVISHLHIMVALLAAAVMLLVFRYTKPKGKWYRIALYLAIPGIIIMSIGAWLVIPDFERAHQIINVGASFLLLSALILTILGWTKISKEKLGTEFDTAPLSKKIRAIFSDPVKFGMYFQFVWVNFVVTIPGIYVAFNLDLYRTDAYTEIERAFNTGHWHVLATLIAIIVLYMLIDIYSVNPKARAAIGWILLAGTVIGFGFTVPYMIRAPGTEKTLFFMLIDVGVALMFLGLALYALFLIIRWIKGDI